MSATRSRAERLQREIASFRNVEVVHDLPEVYHWWSNRWVLPKLQSCGFPSLEEFYLHHLIEVSEEKRGAVGNVISVGAGNGDFEVSLVEKLLERGVRNLRFECLEVNPDMTARGQKLVAERGLAEWVSCRRVDLESWRPRGAVSAFVAVHSLHHIVGLESLFGGMREALEPDGVFLVNDMIGRNGHQRWPEALRLVEDIWAELPRRYKYNHQLKVVEDEFVNRDCAESSNEGVRAQDILPLLLEFFEFETFVAFANVIDVFVDRAYGPNFDVRNPVDLELLEGVARLDEAEIDRGTISPTHMIAALRSPSCSPPPSLRCYTHWTPAFCLRTSPAEPPGGEPG